MASHISGINEAVEAIAFNRDTSESNGIMANNKYLAAVFHSKSKSDPVSEAQMGEAGIISVETVTRQLILASSG